MEGVNAWYTHRDCMLLFSLVLTIFKTCQKASCTFTPARYVDCAPVQIQAPSWLCFPPWQIPQLAKFSYQSNQKCSIPVHQACLALVEQWRQISGYGWSTCHLIYKPSTVQLPPSMYDQSSPPIYAQPGSRLMELLLCSFSHGSLIEHSNSFPLINFPLSVDISATQQFISSELISYVNFRGDGRKDRGPSCELRASGWYEWKCTFYRRISHYEKMFLCEMETAPEVSCERF